MFFRISAFFAVAVAVAVAVANARMERHIHLRNNTAPSQCNTGALQCCNSVFNATDLASMLDRLSVPYDTSDNVGINCTPINIYGVGQAAGCQQQPICCSDNQYHGFVNVGCSPMDFN